MAIEFKVPIKNIYYMLCYAWNIVDYADETVCGIEEFDNIYNLLATILVKEVGLLLKRGFYKEYIQKSIENNTKGRDFLENVLKEAGFEVVKSYASFVYFYPKGITSEDLVNELGSYGVMIRQFGDYSRVSVGLPEQNERFKQTLKQVLNQ